MGKGQKNPGLTVQLYVRCHLVGGMTSGNLETLGFQMVGGYRVGTCRPRKSTCLYCCAYLPRAAGQANGQAANGKETQCGMRCPTLAWALSTQQDPFREMTRIHGPSREPGSPGWLSSVGGWGGGGWCLGAAAASPISTTVIIPDLCVYNSSPPTPVSPASPLAANPTPPETGEEPPACHRAISKQGRGCGGREQSSSRQQGRDEEGGTGRGRGRRREAGTGS